MKILVKEDDSEGFVKLIGKNVMLFCLNYIYTGKLTGVNESCVKLSRPKIVYDTGSFEKKTFSDAQSLSFEIYVQVGAIESFGETDKE